MHLCARPGRVDARRAGRRGRRDAGRLLAVRGLPARRRAGRAGARSATAGRTCRTRAPSWSRPRCWPPRSRAATPGGWTCAPARAARPACWARSPRSAAPRSPRSRSPSTGPGWSSRPPRACRSPCCRWTAAPWAATRTCPRRRFDRVLVDAPCTGLGSLRRRPESRWRRSPADLPPLTRLQRELLVAALRAVRPGGVVAYVTCSPHMVETQVTVTEGARRSGVEVDFVDARPLLPPGMPQPGRRPDRAAVAAPARHRRDVPGGAAPHGLTYCTFSIRINWVGEVDGCHWSGIRTDGHAQSQGGARGARFRPVHAHDPGAGRPGTRHVVPQGRRG